jgi:fucose permease
MLNYKVLQMKRSLSFIGLMFFTCGFALGLNPILLPVLRQSLQVSSLQSYLIVFASFVPFLIWGWPAQASIRRWGYKATMALAFVGFALSFGIYLWAASALSFPLFLLASFVSGSANAVLQASINPYVTFLGPIESGAQRISLMGICNKLAWPLPSLFMVWFVGHEVASLRLSELTSPFMIIIGIMLVLAGACLLFPLPAISLDGNASDPADAGTDAPQSAEPARLADFPHLWLGALTLFLYVGVETVSLATGVDYADSLGLERADLYAWIAPVGMIIGYIAGVILIPRYLSQGAALRICSAIAILGSVLVPLLPAASSIWALGLLALGCSLMWPAIWPLASCDLGSYTAKGNALLTMSIAGGAVIPTVFGALCDASMDACGTIQLAYWICLPCFLFIFIYGVWGHKIRRHRK